MSLRCHRVLCPTENADALLPSWLDLDIMIPTCHEIEYKASVGETNWWKQFFFSRYFYFFFYLTYSLSLSLSIFSSPLRASLTVGVGGAYPLEGGFG